MLDRIHPVRKFNNFVSHKAGMWIHNVTRENTLLSLVFSLASSL